MLVMDRHKRINKFMSQNYSNVKHHYDVWHVAKGNSHISTVGSIILGENRVEEEITKSCQI